MTAQPKPASWRDGAASFGWISIGLHWSAAVLVVALLFIGSATGGSGAAARDHALRLHTSLGLSAYALLWARVAWRALKGHPGPLPSQGRRSYAIGKPFHYVLLGALAIMLVTGPLMAWSGGLPLDLRSVRLPAPMAANPQLFRLTHAGHVAAATVLGWGTLLHILAVIKHIIVDRDGAFDRMLAAARGVERAEP